LQEQTGADVLVQRETANNQQQQQQQQAIRHVHA
jgi:hypothetical protein